jgi:hypothetical protein
VEKALDEKGKALLQEIQEQARARQELIAKLKAEHGGDIYEFSQDGIVVYFRAAKRAEYARFKDRVAEKTNRMLAIDELVISCVVHPAQEAFEAILEKRPALADVLSEEILTIAGAVRGAEVKKL